jgi:general secretion pathway protein G
MIGLSSKQKRSGFTLLEILMVIALLGIIITVVGGKLSSGFGKGKINVAKLQIKQLQGALERYRLDCGFFPTTDQGLESLVTAPTGGRVCKNYDPEGYEKKANLNDPWGSPFKYTCEDGVNFEITSFGEDGIEGGEGRSADIVSEK